jgi:hypothetical protein
VKGYKRNNYGQSNKIYHDLERMKDDEKFNKAINRTRHCPILENNETLLIGNKRIILIDSELLKKGFYPTNPVNFCVQRF